jgi:hypothetical protein
MKLVRYADGNFLLATAISNYIGHPDFSPNERIADFLAFMDGSKRVATHNPLETLDLVYTRILLDVPPTVMPITRRILHHVLYKYDQDSRPQTTQLLANILWLERPDFYTAVRLLYSVLDIPSPQDATKTRIQMYHASFKDFLTSPARSGRFFISKQEALAAFSMSALFWCDIIEKDNAYDGAFYFCLCRGDLCSLGIDPFDRGKTYASSPIMPHLPWSSPDPVVLANEIRFFAYFSPSSWLRATRASQDDLPALFSLLNTFNFRFMDLRCAYNEEFLKFLNWLLRQVRALSVPWPSVTEPLEGSLPIPPSYQACFRP